MLQYFSAEGKENPGYSPGKGRVQYIRAERVGDQNRRKCVEMFLAGTQSESDKPACWDITSTDTDTRIEILQKSSNTGERMTGTVRRGTALV